MQIAVFLPHTSAFAAEGPAAAPLQPQRQMEFLDRGLVAVKVDNGVFVSWRLLGTDPSGIKFNLYRDGVKVNAEPISNSTNYLDISGAPESKYSVRAVLNGQQQEQSKLVGVWGNNYLSVPLHKPEGGTTEQGEAYTYRANDASVGDLDGDGEYEIVLKWDPTNSHDNTGEGITGEVFLDAYKLDGTFMWRIGMGKNIRAGAHYTQFMVYDLDGDGISEIAAKTADGTTDGLGKVIGEPHADYRDKNGRILAGPEYLTIFNGRTGQEMTTTDYDPPRGNVSDWGDNYGNRVDRFLAGIAYLDGQRPSLIMARGYYNPRTVVVAYNWRDGQLTKQWRFDTNNPGYESWRGQGNHSLSVADVDGDGKDEIIYGAMTIDDNGEGLYNTGLGHGDALHVGDLDPTRPGLEVFKVMESTRSPYGAALWDAGNGTVLWGVYTGRDTGRGMSADIDPNYLGEEQWAATGVGLYTNKGQKISSSIPSVNFGIWWDGDLLRELLDDNRIDKWDYNNFTKVNLLTAEGALSNNSTKATPNLQADLFGDWREEAVWRNEDSSALLIYTTTDLTEHRIYTLMHDPVYRLSIAWQNVGYNQPPHTGFYLGHGMQNPPIPNIYLTAPADVEVQPAVLNLKSNSGEYSLTVSISLPDGYNNSQIDLTTVRMIVNGTYIPAQTREEGQGSSRMKVKFDRQQVISALAGQNGLIQASVSGVLNNGTHFHGIGTFKAID
ncbi:rhamnogalacturonan lyase [Paenibacillus sp. OAS669]|uniref:rhamnogalacturonan lyase n=1 Tax=Paenibacillus sp. OAS669 TaxID=2663821 RepID=UPI001CEF5326